MRQQLKHYGNVTNVSFPTDETQYLSGYHLHFIIT